MSTLCMDDLPHQELLTLGGHTTTPHGSNKPLLEDVSVLQCLPPIGTTAIREKKARCNNRVGYRGVITVALCIQRIYIT